jgi:hypothetical protein
MKRNTATVGGCHVVLIHPYYPKAHHELYIKDGKKLYCDTYTYSLQIQRNWER